MTANDPSPKKFAPPPLASSAPFGAKPSAVPRPPAPGSPFHPPSGAAFLPSSATATAAEGGSEVKETRYVMLIWWLAVLGLCIIPGASLISLPMGLREKYRRQKAGEIPSPRLTEALAMSWLFFWSFALLVATFVFAVAVSGGLNEFVENTTEAQRILFGS